jgi:hypothetical protein
MLRQRASRICPNWYRNIWLKVLQLSVSMYRDGSKNKTLTHSRAPQKQQKQQQQQQQHNSNSSNNSDKTTATTATTATSGTTAT